MKNKESGLIRFFASGIYLTLLMAWLTAVFVNAGRGDWGYFLLDFLFPPLAWIQGLIFFFTGDF